MNDELYLEDSVIEEVRDEKSAMQIEGENDGLLNDENEPDIDYEALLSEDLKILKESFPELSDLGDITELENPVRYGALRDLGLSPEEAYRATATKRNVGKIDTRLHLRSSTPKAAKSPVSDMSYREMEIARDIFSGISDAEIRRLYKKVTR